MKLHEPFERDVQQAMRLLVAEPATSNEMFDRVARVAYRRRRIRFGGSVFAVVVAAAAVALGVAGLRPDHVPLAPTVPECPSAAPVRASLNPPDTPGLRDRMVPGRPILAVACQYAGLDEDLAMGSLTNSRIVRDDELAAFVSGLNSAQPLHEGPTSCPADTGTTDLAIFVYADGTTVNVMIHPVGCRSFSNGVISRRPVTDMSAVTIAERE